MALNELVEKLPGSDGLHHVTLANGRQAWLKRRHDRPAAFLAAEARGLQALSDAGGLRVPQVYALEAHLLLIEDLGTGTPRADFATRAGRGLARQHHEPRSRFGFDHDGWCGESAQDNTPDDDGHHFFAHARLLPQGRRALESDLLENADFERLQNLCAQLTRYIPAQPAVLLHGDLWSGNLHCCEDGGPALIDAAAVHHGWAEAELAMLTLFGDPGEAFFRAYAEIAPLANNWRERAPLYNLYHLLNHLNLFGTGYLKPVRDILRRFA